LRRIRWAPAAQDLQGISDYLREHHPAFARPTIQKLYKAAHSLKQFPNRGRMGQKDGTRELVVAPMPYIIVYGVEPDMVHILRIIHASEDWP
jgi:addiction module RelE/StbE family toxin